MNARNNIENITGIQEFDIESTIIPNKGAGGITFNNSILDFNSVLTANMFSNHKTKIKSEINSKYMYLTLKAEKNEFEVHIDLLTGKINSLVCNIGYKGKLLSIGIGAKMSELLKIDNAIYFNLDRSFYIRHPFDGLIIYPPYEISEKIFNAELDNSPIPDFKIETIAILDMEFAKKSFKGTIF